MLKLSPNFSLSEFTNSQTALRRGIDNNPTANEIFNLGLLAKTMELIRSELESPISITSGFRCRTLNNLVGGSLNSSHLSGLACDFIAPKFGDPFDVAHKLSTLPIKFDQLILEFYDNKTGGGWVHIGIGGKNRQQILTINRSGTFTGIIK